MSLGQNLAFQNAQLPKSGQVVELLLDEKGELMDYSFSYPFFSGKKKSSESVQYGIYSLKMNESGHHEIESHRFLTADKAENFLLDVEFSDFHQLSVLREKNMVIIETIR